MGEQGDEPLPGAGRPRPSRRLLLLAAAGAALLIALVVGVTVRPAAVAGDERPVTATSSARSTAHSTTRSAPAPAAPVRPSRRTPRPSPTSTRWHRP